jgi:hypothetical protein
MKRITILLVGLLALVVSACGSGETTESGAASEPAATVEATPVPTPEPTPEPEDSDEPSASEDAGGGESSLLDLLPDEIDGQARVDVDFANNPMFAAALEAQNIDASEVEYIVSTYGSGEGVLAVTAIRIPDMGETELEQLARLMSGMSEGQASAEATTIGGKEVLAISATDVEQTAYMYFLDGAVIVTGGTSQDLAEEFFSQLP